MSSTLRGVLSPVVTPFRSDYSPDIPKLIGHCQWLLSQNCGLAIFGTNSEGNSLSVEEKIDIIDALLDAGLPAKRMMPGTGCCSISDSIKLTAHAVKRGVGGVLMLPPFYYKNVSDEGVFRNFAEIIDKVGDRDLKIYLYNFPALSGVPFSVDLISRLIKAYPQTIVGMKDSSGDKANLDAVMKNFPKFALFAGSESLLLHNMRIGGAGCISATANVNPKAIDQLYANWQANNAETLQEELDQLRSIVQQYVMIPALKELVSHFSGDNEWLRLRPPLTELPEEQRVSLIESVKAIGFDMPGLSQQ